ncbi:hypothetical protein KIW84_051935 [Lathyrus oleraceus]|uniref:Uncharacterized protein n=1 Tax=Pisum sativum TaxID=3888 RepID=A0A9D5AE92_PEA|nr:hypothetical protein KIW84_051935 [Pisum sativum]
MNNKKQVYPTAAIKGVPVARRVVVAPKPVQKKVTAKPKLVDAIDMISSKERDNTRANYQYTNHHEVVLLQIVAPARTDVSEHQKLTSQVHEIVGRINGRFGTLIVVPIHHLDRSLDFHALRASYAVTDVTLVASLRCSTIPWCWCYLGKSSEKETVHNSDGKVGVGPTNTEAPGTGNGHGKTHVSNAKSIKGHRKPSQSFIDVIELLLEPICTCVPPLKDDYYKILVIEEGLVPVPLIGVVAYKSYTPRV